MSEQNKQAVRRYFEELDRAKASPVDLCAPGYTFQAAGLPAMDLEAAEQFTELFFSAFPDLKHPVDELIVEGVRRHAQQRATRLPFVADTRGHIPEQTSWESQRAGETSRRSAPASCASSTARSPNSGSPPTEQRSCSRSVPYPSRTRRPTPAAPPA